MLQSSITTWLRKPATVHTAEEPTSAPVVAPAAILPKEDDPSPVPEIIVDEATKSKVKDRELLAANAFSLPPLPANVELVPLTQELIPSFKRLLALTLPIAYPLIFFSESLTEPYHSISLMALWRSTSPKLETRLTSEKPRLIGAIRCRILPSDTLYISTIGLLAPYRSHGIATHLLRNILAKASKEHGVKSVTAHVWEANEDGLEWYEKRGFEVIGKEQGYYSKLKPSGAILVRKWIGVADLLADAGVASREGK